MTTGNKTASTRKRIEEAALKLFTEKGTRSVNTHAIAGASGLSPGNLYYHFKNKEEIILSIMKQIELFSPDHWKDAISSDKPESFFIFLEFFFTQMQTYRFFFREQGELVRDVKIAQSWRKAHAELRPVMFEAAQHWVDLGLLNRFDSKNEIGTFIDSCWILMSFTHSYFEGMGEKASVLDKRSSEQIFRFLRTFHTRRGKNLLDKYWKTRK